MSELLRAIGVEYEKTVTDPENAQLRLPPYDNPDMKISTYRLDLVTNDSFANNDIDHQVCVTCPLYILDKNWVKKTDKEVICTGPDEVTERQINGLYYLEGGAEVYEHADGMYYGNCGATVDTRRAVKDRVYIR